MTYHVPAGFDVDRAPPKMPKLRANGHAPSVEAPPLQSPPLQSPPLQAMEWAQLEGLEPPRRSFIVEDWLARGVVTSLYGTGGVGKSLLAQKLGASVAAGVPFVGLCTTKAPVVAIFGEDDDDELWRRQHRINASCGLTMPQLAGFAAHGRLGADNMLMVFPKGQLAQPMPLLAEIEATARACGAGLVILDNCAQMFGGDENHRAEVTAFIGALNGLARRLNAAVLLLGHPPKNGAEYSGSTAWHAAVRCMWTLARPVVQGDEGEPSEILLLTRSKANYAPAGEEIRLRWVDGVLCREEFDAPGSEIDASFHAHAAGAAFLAALDELTAQRRNVSHADRAGNFAPKAMKAAGLAERFTKADLKRAMNRLFGDRIIVANTELWRGADRKSVLGIARVGAGQSQVVVA